MNNPSSIVLLAYHYGSYPWFFSYFLHACKFNPTIDFIILTDNTEVIPDKPNNVKIVYSTLEAFKLNASEKLGFDVCITNQNKVSDFKPAYGFLFPEIITPYDFWGYTDIDIIFGNIRDFITPEVLERDIISGRHDVVFGKFCLYRNNEMNKTLFTQSRDYKYIFTKPQKFYFDECNVFFYDEDDYYYPILHFSSNIQTMTYVVKKAETEGTVSVFFDFLGLKSVTKGIYWEKGILNYKYQYECMYCDVSFYSSFCKNKKVLNPIPNKLYFGSKGIRKIRFFERFLIKIGSKRYLSKNN